jgi:hypothetical protein
MLLNVVSFLAESTTGPWVWRIPSRNAAVLLHNNIRNYMSELPSTTPKRLNITQGRMLPQFTTPRNLSITLLRATTEAPVYYTTNASECYMIIYAAPNYYTGASNFEVQHHRCTNNLQARVNMLFYIV